MATEHVEVVLTPPSQKVRAQMAAQKTKGTAAELALRSALHQRGLRYRVHRQPVAKVRRTADLVFPSARVAVMVDGCFWHSCPLHGTLPKANGQWWDAKLKRNAARDRETDGVLRRAGWLVIRVWEHERPGDAADVIEAAVRGRRPAG